MKKTLLISGLLLALTASVASAGVNLAWTNCHGGGGVENVAFACNTNTGTAGVLTSSFVASGGQQVAAFEFVIDIESAGATLPAWWTIGAAPNCRAANTVTINTNFTTAVGCADPWGNTVGLSSVTVLAGFSGPNTARIRGGGSVPASAPVPVEAALEYYGFQLIMNRSKTTGLGACAGCLDPVCLVLNEITLFNEVGAKTSISSPESRNFVTWQGGQIGDPAGCPAATPTTKTTWGKIKSIYR